MPCAGTYLYPIKLVTVVRTAHDETLFSFCRNKEEITEERLSQARVFVLAGSREKFSAAEVSYSLVYDLQWPCIDNFERQIQYPTNTFL